MSYLPETAHLGLHYPDKYIDVLFQCLIPQKVQKLIQLITTKSSKVNSTHDLDSYLISAGPDELPP